MSLNGIGHVVYCLIYYGQVDPKMLSILRLFVIFIQSSALPSTEYMFSMYRSSRSDSMTIYVLIWRPYRESNLEILNLNLNKNQADFAKRILIRVLNYLRKRRSGFCSKGVSEIWWYSVILIYHYFSWFHFNLRSAKFVWKFSNHIRKVFISLLKFVCLNI